MGEKIKWVPPENYVCPHCGGQNPDNGDKCGNCEKNPFELPDETALLTKEQLETLKTVTRRSNLKK